MPGGESVGTAYVRILADGDGLDRSIRDQLDDVEWDKNGRKASQKWTNGWIEEIQKAPNQTKLRDSVAGPLVKGDWLTTEFFRSKNWKNFRSSLEKEFGAAGVRTGDALEKGLLEGMDFKTLNKKLGNLTPELVRQQKIINAELEKQKQATRDWEAEWHRDTQKIMKDMRRTSQTLVRELGTHDKALKQTRTSLFRFGDAFKRDFLPWFSRGANETRKFRTRLQQVDDGVDKFSDGIGTAFGRGSRNNFLNFFGSLTRNITLVAFNALPKMIKGFLRVKDVFSEMSTVFSAKGGGFAGLLGAAGVGGRAMASLAAGVAAVGVGLVALVVIIGPIISLVSGLVAAVTALASSLTFAAFGAVAPLVGALLPLIAGIGVVTGAILTMDDAMKKRLTKSIKPLVTEFKTLGRIAGKELFKDAPAQAARLSKVFNGLRPLARRLGDAMHDVGVRFIDGLSSPAFNAFKKEMTTFLPNAARTLGNIFVNTFSGLGGLFRSMIPITNRFLGWLEKITEEFSKWANSAEGQRELKQFFKDAGDSAAQFGGFLKSLTVALATLFDAGRKPGDNIFKQMQTGLTNLTNFLKRDGGKGMADWFSHGQQTAKEMGNIIHRVSRLLDTLDSPQNRRIGRAILGTIAAALTLIDVAAHPLLPTLGKLAGKLKAIGDAGKLMQKLFVNAMAGVIDHLALMMKTWGKMLSALGHVPGFGWAKTAGKLMQGAASDAGHLADKIRNIPKNTKPKVKVDVNGTGALNTAINLINAIHRADGTHSNLYVTTHVSRVNAAGYPGPRTASGGMFNYAQTRLIGEAGPEAVVPLNRPLGQVDPSVRWLSAFAQGKTDRMAAGGIVGGGRTVNFENAQFISNSPDPLVAAREWTSQVVASAF